MWVVVGQVVQFIGVDRLSRWAKIWLAATVAMLVLVPVACTTVVMSAMSGAQLLYAAQGQGVSRQCRAPAAVGVSDPASGIWNGDQRANAAAIVKQGAAMGVPARGWVVAVATAMQESTLINVDGGDRDSGGLFQQRPSQGWGTFEQVRDPVYASTAFYQRLIAIAGWEELPLTRAAQAVQRSAYPDRYARWEDGAQALVTELTGGEGLEQVWCHSTPSVGGWNLPLDPAFIVPPMKDHHRAADGGPGFPAVDIGVEVGQPVYAMRGGTVRTVDEPGGCGNGIAVTDAEGAEWIYCHASRLTAVGGNVAAGQEIMLSGGAAGAPGSGSSTGPHLHVQVRAGGSLRCVGFVIDALATGQQPPEVGALKASWPCYA